MMGLCNTEGSACFMGLCDGLSLFIGWLCLIGRGSDLDDGIEALGFLAIIEF